MWRAGLPLAGDRHDRAGWRRRPSGRLPALGLHARPTQRALRRGRWRDPAAGLDDRSATCPSSGSSTTTRGSSRPVASAISAPGWPCPRPTAWRPCAMGSWSATASPGHAGSGSRSARSFADDAPTAEALYAGLAAWTGAQPIFLDVPESNAAAVALAERHGLTPGFETARMYRRRGPGRAGRAHLRGDVLRARLRPGFSAARRAAGPGAGRRGTCRRVRARTARWMPTGPEADGLVGGDGPGVGRRRVDGQAVVAALVEQPARDGPDGVATRDRGPGSPARGTGRARRAGSPGRPPRWPGCCPRPARRPR